MIEKLYTVEEVAELASVTGRTIRNYLKSGRLKGRKIGGQWRFPESEVQRLLTGVDEEPDEISENERVFAEDTETDADDMDFYADDEFEEDSRYVVEQPLQAQERAARTTQQEEQLYEQARPVRETHAGYVEPAVLPVPQQPHGGQQPAMQQPMAPPMGQPVAQQSNEPSSNFGQAGSFSPPPTSNTGTFTPPVYSPQPQGGHTQQQAAMSPQQNPAGNYANAPVMQHQTHQQPQQTTYAPVYNNTNPPVPPAHPGYASSLYNQSQPQQQPPVGYMPQQQINPYATGQFPAVTPPQQEQQSYPGSSYDAQGYNSPYFGTYPHPGSHPGAYAPPASAPYPTEPPMQEKPEPPKALEAKPAATAPYKETAASAETSAAATESAPPATEPVSEANENTVEIPELSDVGMRVAHFVAEVHDCSDGPQTCAIIDMYQSFETAKETSEHIAEIAAQESERGSILCQSFVEYDARYYIARYTLFGSSLFLSRCLKLIG